MFRVDFRSGRTSPRAANFALAASSVGAVAYGDVAVRHAECRLIVAELPRLVDPKDTGDFYPTDDTGLLEEIVDVILK